MEKCGCLVCVRADMRGHGFDWMMWESPEVALEVPESENV